MDLYCLGKVPWYESQLIYHSLASLGREALSLVSPSTPYVCIGYHQDAKQEVDLDFCQTNNIPVFRREVGGGAVYLDGSQFFYQLILRKDNPLAPLKKEAFYRKFLQPIIDVYRRIGIPAEFKPINDVIVETRKISGTGVGEIGDCIVFVGNLIYDFDYKIMSRVLQIPDEKFRDKVKKTIEENMSTIQRELTGTKAAQWNEDNLNALMVEEFERLFGPLEPKGKDPELMDKVADLGARMMTGKWLHRKNRRTSGREIKIRSGVEVMHRMHKAPGGLIRGEFEINNGCFANVSLSGDWFCYPEDAISVLESNLVGKSFEQARMTLENFYAGQEVETPGISIDDWMKVLEV